VPASRLILGHGAAERFGVDGEPVEERECGERGELGERLTAGR
jgi:hypothetical protein